MSIDHLLGRLATLTVERIGAPGAFLVESRGTEGATTVLLPRAEVGAGVRVGDEVEVFVYLDSEDRPVATTREPRLTLGEVAFLEVTAITRVGAFVDWGLPKELLVPFSEQITELQQGNRYPIGLYLDKTGRLAGTTRVSELLQDVGDFEEGEWVQGEAWRKREGLGVFVIVERRFVGLLPEDEPNALRRGEAARFRVATVLPDGKIALSLRNHAHEEVEGDAERVLAALRKPGAPRVGDRSSPEQIRATFGLSKKAYKRALGHLLKGRKIDIDGEGFPRVL
ncbi:MAG: S1-like domain-containing RNA-binding protein [Polyangiaceae bacterium]|nr:S1-like domain-containing RNA-binding protein [Polyangiaceae bacterium]